MTIPETANRLSAPSPAPLVSLRRIIDASCAGAAILLLSPVFLIVGLAVWIEGGRPILFSQPRLGLKGKVFRIYKFRKFKLNSDLPNYPLTMDGDQRMTAVGRILASTKLDELPQLCNVLRGDMSLVGPRPESLEFRDCFRNGFEKLLDHKPGLFGPCQVLFRHESKLYPADACATDYYRKVLFPAKAKIDLAYFPRRSLASDLGWIFRSAGVIAAECWDLLTRTRRAKDSRHQQETRP